MSVQKQAKLPKTNKNQPILPTLKSADNSPCFNTGISLYIKEMFFFNRSYLHMVNSFVYVYIEDLKQFKIVTGTGTSG